MNPSDPETNGAPPPAIARVLLVEARSDVAGAMSEAIVWRSPGVELTRVSTLEELRTKNLRGFEMALVGGGMGEEWAVEALGLIQSRAPGLVAMHVSAGGFVGPAHAPLLAIEVARAAESATVMANLEEENRALKEELARTRSSLEHTRREVDIAMETLRDAAQTDVLTGLGNRRLLATVLDRMYAEAVRYGTDLSCMMIDMDGFKTVNDTLGHQRGDELLRILGDVIRGCVRSSDVAARFGGDEFVILLPRTNCSTAAALATRLSNAFQVAANRMHRVGLRCGMSVGISSVQMSGPADGEHLLAHADNALYAAKAGGKRRVMVCGPDGITAVEPEAVAG